ncbi:MAG: DoxX family protein [Frankiales bacterium]|nr:DoxX family protein [Frankiales bacterium]
MPPLAAARVMKLSQPRATLARLGLGWTEDVSDTQVDGIGAVELLALGLILPAAPGIATVLSPTAAGLALTMVGAAVVHLRRGEGSSPPLVLGALASSSLSCASAPTPSEQHAPAAAMCTDGAARGGAPHGPTRTCKHEDHRQV